MAFYECIFIARQDITSTQVEALTDQFSEILKENGGDVAAKEQWGLRTLAYKIKKNRKGHYVMLKIEAASPALLEMERRMRLNEDVLRYMSVRVDELDPQPSAVLQNKDRGGRDDRGGRRGRFGDGGPSGGHSGGGHSGGRKFDDKAPAE